MKIRCIKLVDGFGKATTNSQWESVGTTYDVLSLEVCSDGRTLVRFVGDREKMPALRPLEQFEIVDHGIPENWTVFTKLRGGGIVFGPAAWASPGFWERFFDFDPAATQSFERERAIITG